MCLFCHSASAQKAGCIYANLERVSADSVYVSIHNETCDSIFIFSTYLPDGYDILSHNDHSLSEYLHRFNPDENRYTISFIPIKNLLFFGCPDMVYIGKEAVYNGCLGYAFKPITSNGSITVALPITSIVQKDYVEEFYPGKDDYNPAIRTKYKERLKKLKRYILKDAGCVYVEFALFFKNTLPDILSEHRIADWTQETLRNYIIVSLPIILNE